MSVSARHMESITTRGRVETRRGRLESRDRVPTAETAQRRYGRLDFGRGGGSAAIDCIRKELLSVGGEENPLP